MYGQLPPVRHNGVVHDTKKTPQLLAAEEHAYHRKVARGAAAEEPSAEAQAVLDAIAPAESNANNADRAINPTLVVGVGVLGVGTELSGFGQTAAPAGE